MAIFFQHGNKTQVSIRNTVSEIGTVNNPKSDNYATNLDGFGFDDYQKSNLQFGAIFNFGKKQYKRLSINNY